MSLTLVLILATGASLKHGTQAECEAWYPAEPNAQVACMELDPQSPMYQEAMRRMQICKDIRHAVESKGVTLKSATYEGTDGPATCNYEKG